MNSRMFREDLLSSYEENQFRIDGTLKFPIHAFEISARNMYVRRLRPTPTRRYEPLSRSNLNRASPRGARGRIWKPFVSYEAFYSRQWRVEQRSIHGWRHGAAPEARVVSAIVHVGRQ